MWILYDDLEAKGRKDEWWIENVHMIPGHAPTDEQNERMDEMVLRPARGR